MVAARDKARAKHPIIREALRRAVADGTLKDRIPSLRELSRAHDVSITTANKAVQSLIDERILVRRKGLGTFVRRTSDFSRRLVAILMVGSGHVYERMAKSIQRELRDHDFLPVMIDIGGFDGKRILVDLKRVLAMRPEALVFQPDFETTGPESVPFLRGKTKKIRKLVIVNDGGGNRDLQACRVRSDAWLGGYLATRHLLERGHRRILHFTHRNRVVPPERFRFHEAFQKELGYLMAMEEAGLAPEVIRQEPEGGDTDGVAEWLALEDRPTAVFASQDSRTVAVLKVARGLGLRVPDDLALVGYYDTPWCEAVDPALTSVTIHEEAFGRAVAEMVLAPDKTGERLVPDPELTIRSST